MIKSDQAEFKNKDKPEMKKIAFLAAFFAVVSSASAAQISWGTTGAMFNGTEQMKTASGYTTTAYLLYLGDASATWESYGFDINTFMSEKDSVAISTKTSTAPGMINANSGNYAISVGDTIKNSTDTLVDGGSNFGIVFISSGTGWGDDKDHYFLGEVGTFSTSSANYTAATESFKLAPSIPSGSTWQAVPEPSVALMGLLGIGMLIRRRKA